MEPAPPRRPADPLEPALRAWYPTTWLLALLPAPAALHVTILLHAAWAFAGAWRLARRLGAGTAAAALGALAYAGSGGFVSLTSSLLLFTGMAWLPWVLAWGDRLIAPPGRRAPARGAAPRRFCSWPPGWRSSSSTATRPRSRWPAWVSLAIAATAPRGERRPAWSRLGLALLLALGLGAVQILPTWSRLLESTRGEGLGFAQATAWSTRPARLVELAFPHFYGDATRDEEDLYFGWRLHDKQYPFLLSISPGLLTLVLAVAGLARGPLPRRRAWAAGALAGIFLGLGRHNPLFAALYGAVPLLAPCAIPRSSCS